MAPDWSSRATPDIPGFRGFGRQPAAVRSPHACRRRPGPGGAAPPGAALAQGAAGAGAGGGTPGGAVRRARVAAHRSGDLCRDLTAGRRADARVVAAPGAVRTAVHHDGQPVDRAAAGWDAGRVAGCRTRTVGAVA